MAEYDFRERIYVMPVNDGLQAVCLWPVLLPEGKWFILYDPKRCTGQCTYVHSQVEREVWNTELVYFYCDVSLPKMYHWNWHIQHLNAAYKVYMTLHCLNSAQR